MESIDFVFSDRATVPGFLGMNCQQALLDQIMALNPDKILFVTETNVDCYHANYFKPLLDTDLVEKRVLPSGDEVSAMIFETLVLPPFLSLSTSFLLLPPPLQPSLPQPYPLQPSSLP